MVFETKPMSAKSRLNHMKVVSNSATEVNAARLCLPLPPFSPLKSPVRRRRRRLRRPSAIFVRDSLAARNTKKEAEGYKRHEMATVHASFLELATRVGIHQHPNVT